LFCSPIAVSAFIKDDLVMSLLIPVVDFLTFLICGLIFSERISLSAGIENGSDPLEMSVFKFYFISL
jgi:hypothetical protein